MRGNTVTKSIRFRQPDVDYIETQPGNTFTEKLAGVLDEYQRGEAKRKSQIEYYDNLIKKRREELQAYNDMIINFQQIRRDAVSIEALFGRIMDRLQKSSQ